MGKYFEVHAKHIRRIFSDGRIKYVINESEILFFNTNQLVSFSKREDDYVISLNKDFWIDVYTIEEKDYDVRIKHGELFIEPKE